MQRKRKKKNSTGLFFWIAFILLVLLLFFVNKKTISQVLKRTNAKEYFVKETESDENDTSDSQVKSELSKISSSPAEHGNEERGSINNLPHSKTESAEIYGSQKPLSNFDSGNSLTETQPIKKNTQEYSKPSYETRPAVLYFISIDNDGKMTRHQVVRNLKKTESPLSDVLKSLFKGTAIEESKKGLKSLIPPGTRLISASVKDGVAMINLSEEFQFNKYGIEGYTAQLAQVVFTASVFPTVKSVQFLIEGKKIEYLAGEGVWIGTPLSEDSF